MKILKLIRRYKLQSLRMLFELAFRDTVRVPVNGKTFYQHKDRSTLYHIVESYPKVQALVASLPDDLSGTVIDGGANCGLFSFMIEQRYPKCKPIALEPNEKAHSNLIINLKNKYRAYRLALSDQNGMAMFYEDMGSDQTGSLVLSNVPSPDPVYSGLVSTKTLDFLTRDDDRIAVVKLDLQGGELAALRGATETLAKTDYLMLEVYMKAPGALEAAQIALKHFPYWKAINSVPYGADILFSKKPI